MTAPQVFDMLQSGWLPCFDLSKRQVVVRADDVTFQMLQAVTDHRAEEKDPRR